MNSWICCLIQPTLTSTWDVEIIIELCSLVKLAVFIGLRLILVGHWFIILGLDLLRRRLWSSSACF